MLKANLFPAIIVLAVLAGMLFFAPAAPILYAVVALIIVALVAYLVYLPFLFKTSKIFLYKHFAYFQIGIFFKHYYFALYDNVKDITTIRYPFSSFGLISFNVAGEALAGNQQRQSRPFGGRQPQGMLVPHHFVMQFVPRIQEKDELIDLIFYKRPTAQEVSNIEANIGQYTAKNLMLAKPMASNSLFWTGIILGFLTLIVGTILAVTIPLLLVGLFALDAIIIGLVIWKVRVMSYAIQPYRVIAKSGILYKTQISIVFTKIDHLKSFQGLTHKIFRNGTVIVHTTGSSLPEITVRDIPNWNEFYAELEKYY